MDNQNTSTSLLAQKQAGTWHTYDSSQGLIIATALLFQDRDGYLWIGAHGPVGVCRYDGVEFTYFSTRDGLCDNHVQFLYEDQGGILWIGGYNTGITRFDGDRFTPYKPPDGLPGRMVGMCEDAAGTLWFGTRDQGVYAYDGREVVRYQREFERCEVRCLYQDAQDRIWFGTTRGVSCYDKGTFVYYNSPQDGLNLSETWIIDEDVHGCIWFGGSKGLFRFDRNGFTGYATHYRTPSRGIWGLCCDRAGRVWVGGDSGGVTCLDGDTLTTYTHQDGLYDDIVSDIIEDREGNLWFTHPMGGLSRFEPDTFQLLCDDVIPHFGFCRDEQDRIWFSSNDRIGCIEDQTVRRLTMPSPIMDLLPDTSGGLWGTGIDHGVYRFPDRNDIYSETPQLLAEAEGLTSLRAATLAEDRDGGIWVGMMGGGLFYYDGHRFEQKLTSPDQIVKICQDQHGVIWLGNWIQSSFNHGLTRYDGHEARTYTVTDGLPANFVRWIFEGRDGRLWICTAGGGICYIPSSPSSRSGKEKVRFESLDFNEDLRHIWVSRAYEDTGGRIWFGTLAAGVYCYDGRNIQTIDQQDGLPSSSIAGIIQMTDGSMVFGTQNGIVRYRPGPACPPPVFIRRVIADEVYAADDAIDLTTTTADRVSFYFRGISFHTRRMRYTYRLDGFDTGWRATWNERVTYEDLPPGEYGFQVTAIDRNLVYSEAPAVVKLTVRPDPRNEKIAVLQTEVNRLRREQNRRYDFTSIIGHSNAIRQTWMLMEKAIDSGLDVLISGETGTGKELSARAIHYHSPRRQAPFKALNCGAIPRDLVSATLFGYRKGAYTGANEDTLGLFEATDGGTLILDEIGEMTLEAQVHLLRVLQDRQVQRIGETKMRDVDVRVIALTNIDLENRVNKGQFREDLYYRLNVFPIGMPSLRERIDDIPLLAEHFLKDACDRVGKSVCGLAPDVIEMLQAYHWPGNVREFENVINRAIAMAGDDDVIHRFHFSIAVNRDEHLIQDCLKGENKYTDSLNRFRRSLIGQALRECEGNRTETAKKLGVQRPNLITMIKRLGLEDIK